MNKYRPPGAAPNPIAKRDPRRKAEIHPKPNFCPIAYEAVLEVLG